MWRRVFVYSGASVAAVGAGLTRMAVKNHQKGRVPKDAKYQYSSVASREDMILRMKDEVFDVLVIGGGATGSGVTMDAASRGLRVAMVEADDFSSGTSSRSTKLIHGGIRYLEAALTKLDINQFKLVCEALEERAHLMKSAPYMTRPLPILMPIYRAIDVPQFWIGVKLYDWIGKVVTLFETGLPNCFYISKSNSCFFFPLLNPKKLKGSLVYYDGQSNDSRLNLHLALTAAMPKYIEGMPGAAIANHCRVTGIKRHPSSPKDTTTVLIEDTLTGESFTIEAKAVVNCTGPFSDQMRQKMDTTARKLVQAASGVHVVLPAFYSSPMFGMIIPETTDKRVLFYLPWEGNTLAGTTDEPSKIKQLPQATKREVDFVVAESCRYLSLEEGLLRKDIKSTWSGIRPLVSDPRAVDDGKTAKLSRSHEIVVEKNGTVSVLGGKWTTYRRMAQDAMDKVVDLHKDKFPNLRRPRTKFMLLSNAIDTTGQFETKDAHPSGGRLPVFLMHTYGLTLSQAQHLVRNYGFRSLDLCALGKDTDLLQPLSENHPFLKAEVLYGVRHEMARTPSDVLGRRLRLAFVDTRSARNVLEEVVTMMGSELKWSPETQDKMREEGKSYLDTMLVSDFNQKQH